MVWGWWWLERKGGGREGRLRSTFRSQSMPFVRSFFFFLLLSSCPLSPFFSLSRSTPRRSAYLPLARRTALGAHEAFPDREDSRGKKGEFSDDCRLNLFLFSSPPSFGLRALSRFALSVVLRREARPSASWNEGSREEGERVEREGERVFFPLSLSFFYCRRRAIEEEKEK